MTVYRVERTKWTAERTEDNRLFGGIEETYYDFVNADSYVTDEIGMLTFYTKDPAKAVASYQSANWVSVTQYDEGQLNASTSS